MKIVIYNLNLDGTIPDYIIDGGYLAWDNGGTSPQNLDLIGLAKDEAPEQEFINQNALLNYAQEKNFVFEDIRTGEITPLEIVVAELWAKLN